MARFRNSDGGFSVKKSSIKKHLKPASIMERVSTINGAFAAALMPWEPYDEERVCAALDILRQDPERLTCVYCSHPAQTWDHLVPKTKGKRPNGPGHRLGNLVPSCATCNSKKRGMDWRVFVAQSQRTDTAVLERYIEHFPGRHVGDDLFENPKVRQFYEVRDAIVSLMKVADGLAKEIRADLETCDVDWTETLIALELPPQIGRIAPPDLSLPPIGNFYPTPNSRAE